MSETIHLEGIDVSYDREMAVKAAGHLLLALKVLHGAPVLNENLLDLADLVFAKILGDAEEIALAAELIEEAICSGAGA